MPVFEDVRDSLGRLRADGWRLAILTNCDDDLIAQSVARIPVDIDLIVTAEQVGSYKPAADLSLDEYRWIRDQAYRALGQPFVDLDIAKLVEEAGRGVTSSDTVGQLKGAIGATGPEVNRKLIERVKKVLEDNLALASFGL